MAQYVEPDPELFLDQDIEQPLYLDMELPLYLDMELPLFLDTEQLGDLEIGDVDIGDADIEDADMQQFFNQGESMISQQDQSLVTLPTRKTIKDAFLYWSDRWDVLMELAELKKARFSMFDVRDHFLAKSPPVDIKPSGWQAAWNRLQNELRALKAATDEDISGRPARLEKSICQLSLTIDPAFRAGQIDRSGFNERVAESMPRHGCQKVWSARKVEYALANGGWELLENGV